MFISVNFCIDEKCLVGVTSCQSIGKLFDSEIYQITDVTFISLSGNEISSSLTSEVGLVFSYLYDLTENITTVKMYS